MPLPFVDFLKIYTVLYYFCKIYIFLAILYNSMPVFQALTSVSLTYYWD